MIQVCCVVGGQVLHQALERRSVGPEAEERTDTSLADRDAATLSLHEIICMLTNGKPRSGAALKQRVERLKNKRICVDKDDV
tara:strand:+ start:828 stop:1073 length:246 start_codon:yes stop_codon:yes gene_type:complete